MSPEQAERKETDRRTDIWSLGVVVYEMVSGRLPFEGENEHGILYAIINSEPEPLTALRVGLPVELDRIVAKAMAKEPGQRYQHVDDLQVDLGALRDSLRPVSVLTPRMTPARTLASRLWPAALVAVVLTAVSAAWLFRSKPGVPSAATLRPPTPLTTYPGREVFPTFSPDGARVAFAWEGESRDNWDIYVKLIGENSRVPLTTDPAEDTAPTWSPDGRRVAFLRRDRTAGTASVMFVPSVGGNPRVVVRRSFFGAGTTPVLNQAARPLSWHPDSEHLLALLPESDSTQPELQVVNVETGSTRKLFAGENEGRDNDPAVSPDGRLLAFRRGTTYADGIYVVELTDTIEAAGEPRKVSGVLPGFAPAWSHDSQELVFAAGVTEGARLWRVAARGGEARVVQHPSMGAFPAISPAGGRAAFALITRNVDIWQAQLPGMTDQKPLIESTLFDVTPQYSPDGERIAFSSARSGYREIWVCDQDGSGAIQLTQLESRISSMPQWSPDGSRIVFQSYVGDQLDIFTMPSGGGKAEQLTEHPGMDFQPSWSRDGEWIYFSSDRSGQPSIWKTPATGGDSVQVTSEPGRYAVESPDGQTLYFVGPEALQAVPVRGGAAESLVEGRMYADGISIADVGVYMMREARSVLDFYDFRSKKVRRVFEFPGTVFSTISVSPDGKTILFAPIEPPESDIMLIDEFR